MYGRGLQRRGERQLHNLDVETRRDLDVEHYRVQLFMEPGLRLCGLCPPPFWTESQILWTYKPLDTFIQNKM